MITEAKESSRELFALLQREESTRSPSQERTRSRSSDSIGGDKMAAVGAIAIAVLFLFCLILAFLLGVFVASGGETIAEHAAYIRGIEAGRKEEKERQENERKRTPEGKA